jgi:hypothetical protein
MPSTYEGIGGFAGAVWWTRDPGGEHRVSRGQATLGGADGLLGRDGRE